VDYREPGGVFGTFTLHLLRGDALLFGSCFRSSSAISIQRRFTAHPRKSHSLQGLRSYQYTRETAAFSAMNQSAHWAAFVLRAWSGRDNFRDSVCSG
jgi:hypothetical protein